MGLVVVVWLCQAARCGRKSLGAGAESCGRSFLEGDACCGRELCGGCELWSEFSGGSRILWMEVVSRY